MLRDSILIALALSSLAGAEQLPVHAYTTTEGLPHNHINRIRQDSRGYLWFATDGGLARFDGRELTAYTVADGLPHPWVNDFIEARDGTYWVATDGGVVQFNPRGISARERKTGAAPPMFQVIGPPPPSPAQASRVNALTEDKDGSLLCATYDGLYRLRRLAGKMEFEKVEIGLPSRKFEGYLVNNITASRQGGWWLAARYGIVRMFEDGRTVRYTEANGLPEELIESIAEDREGRIWAATRHGFCQIRQAAAERGRIVERCYSIADGLPDDDVRTILETSDGTLWIGTGGGLSEFHPERVASMFKTYSSPNSLTDRHILKLAEDSDGNLWAGTMYGGVMRMPREGFVTFREQDGFSAGQYYSILETTAGELAILSENGNRPFIQVFDGLRFHRVSINVPSRLQYATPAQAGAIQDHNGEWWIGTLNGLFRFPRSASIGNLSLLRPERVRTELGVGDLIEALYEDGHGDLWISSSVGDERYFSQWNRKLGRFHNFGDESWLKQYGVHTFQEDASGSLWIGLSFDGGLIRRRRGRFEPLNAPEGIFGGYVEAIHLARSGQLWVATTRGGLIRLENPDSDDPRITAYTVSDGLSSNLVHCITEDQWGRIYAGTDRGVDRLNPETGRIRHFTSADGLEQGSVLLSHRDRKGALWFVASAGISRLIPAPDSVPPAHTTLINALWIMGTQYPISALGETELHSLEVGPGSNELQVDFGNPELRSSAQVQYQYELEGADGKWSKPTSDRTVHYANLSPGKYRFLVRAVSEAGTISQPASVSFEVLTPFWRKWWFLALLLVSALALGYLAHRYRVSQLLALERVRTRIATDLHDDIGSSLSQIAILSEVAHRRVNGQSPDLEAPLHDIGSISREVVESMSDIVWSIDPEQDRLRELCYRMRRFAMDVLTAPNIQLRFEAPSDEDFPVDPDLRRQIFLVFKEAVHNVVRHSGCTEAAVLVRVEQGSLRLRVWDNGNGINLETADRGHGLRSMRQRATGIGGEIQISSHPGQGTTVDLSVPLRRRPMSNSRTNM